MKRLVVLLFSVLISNQLFSQQCVIELSQNDTVICKSNTFNFKINRLDTTVTVQLMARNAGNAVYLNGKVYIIGGDDRINPLPAGNISQVEILDLNNYQVSLGASFPAPRSELGLVVANNKIYAIGGYNGGATNLVNEYDPISNTWTTKAPMPTARSVFSAAAVNNIIYCAGGWPGNINTLEAFDPVSNTWSVKANMPLPLQNFNSMVALNNKLYFIGGRDASASVFYNRVFEYNPATDIWVEKSPMPAARFAGAAVTNGAEIFYIAGGTTNQFNSGTNTIYIYNPATDQWSLSNYQLPVARVRHSAVYANGQLWVFQGIGTDDKLIRDIWSTKYIDYKIRWSTGETTNSITVTPTSTTTYWGEMYNSNNSCRDSVTITIQNITGGVRYPVINSTAGATEQFNARPIGQNYIWKPVSGISNPNIANPILSVTNSQLYTVSITKPDGCIVVDTQQVVVQGGEYLYLPSAFTPNSDGKNDLFRPVFSGIKEIAFFRIYNRWGELVYEQKKVNSIKGWDGKFRNIPQPIGIYVWVIEYTGNSSTIYSKKGTTLLTR